MLLHRPDTAPLATEAAHGLVYDSLPMPGQARRPGQRVPLGTHTVQTRFSANRFVPAKRAPCFRLPRTEAQAKRCAAASAPRQLLRPLRVRFAVLCGIERSIVQDLEQW